MQERKNLIVCKASAGSGKTFKLVNEYLLLCLQTKNAFKFSKILAITFSNKAANEMRERVLEHLRALSAKENTVDFNPDLFNHYLKIAQLSEDELRQRATAIFQAILHNYSSLGISTIDKFTHKIVRSFAKDLKLAVDFDVATNTEITLEKTVEEVVSLAGLDESVTKMLTQYVQSLLSAEKSWNVENNMYNFSKNLINENSSVHLEQLKDFTTQDFEDLIIKLNQAIQDEERFLNRLASDFFILYKKGGMNDQMFKYIKNGVQKLFFHIQSKNFDELKLGKQIAGMTLDKSYFKQEEIGDVPQNIIDGLLSIIAELIHWITKKQLTYRSIKLIKTNIYNLSLSQKLFQKFKEISNDENIVFINEFNKIISDVIQNDPAPFIYERIGERYQHILIDEFQDTSVLQFNNLIPLLINSMANGNQCLLVGDPKQAIYRWRNGDVDQFVALPKLIHHNNEINKNYFKENFIEENLTTNYRSGEHIVNFYNLLFQRVAQNLATEYQLIYSTLKQASKHKNGYVELNLMNETGVELMDETIITTLNKVKECLNDGFSYNDIAILVRNKKEGLKILEKFYEWNIPITSKDSLLLSNSIQLQFLVSFLKHILYPNDRNNNFKLIESYQRIIDDKNNNFEYLSKYITEERRILVDHFFKDLDISYSISYLRNQNVYQLAEELISLFFNGKKDSFLRYFCEYVYSLWQQQSVSIHDVCIWWEEEGNEKSIESDDNSNAIHLMTLHASKGLQFPVVIFPFATWNDKGKPANIWINIDKEKFVLPTLLVNSKSSIMDNTLYQEEKTKESEKATLDDVNLYYVAFTRPENRLYIITSHNDSFKKNIADAAFEIMTKTDDGYHFGEKTFYEKQQPSNIIENTINYDNEIKWEERLRLSIDQGTETEKNLRYESKLIGILLHEIFEKFTDLSFALSYMQTKVKEHPIYLNHLESIQKQIHSTYENKTISHLLQSQNILNEPEIIDSIGKSYRPDKIFIQGNQITILDYKTGDLNEEHVLQINHYAGLLIEIGYEVEKKYLYYTKNETLLAV